MKPLLTAAGIMLALAFMALSAIINWRYGASIGRDGTDQLIYAAVSLTADLAKAVTPFFFWYAALNRHVIPAAAAALLWGACTAYSLASAAGFAEVSRAAQGGTVAVAKTEHDALNASLARKKEQIKALGPVSPEGIIRQRLETLRQDARWNRTKNCTAATVRDSRAFCAEYSEVSENLERARAAAALERETDDLRRRVAAIAGTAQLEDADPRAGFVAKLTGWNAAAVQTGFVLLFIAVLEIGSGLGLFIALSHGGADRPQQVSTAAAVQAPSVTPSVIAAGGPGDVAKFARAMLAGAEGQELSFDELYAAYTVWCARQSLTPLERAAFDQRFTALCREVGFQPQRRGRMKVIRDLQITA